MKDEAWAKLIYRAGEAQRKADALRKRAENEYERRYGMHPSDIDDDWFIDSVQTGFNGDIETLKRQAELSVDLAKKQHR